VTSSNSAFLRFEKLTAQTASHGLDDTRLWKLQVAARDAILSANAEMLSRSGEALEKITKTAQLLLTGSTASLVVRAGEKWLIKAATGARKNSLIGMEVDPDGDSVSAKVIRSRKPFYFTDISSLEDTSRSGGDRQASDLFCSFPVVSEEGKIMAVLNVSGMLKIHPFFTREKSSIEGVLSAIATQLQKIEKNDQVRLMKGDIEKMQETETLRERLLFMTVHDYKNPLSLIISNLGYLEGLTLEPEAEEMVKLSRFGCERLLDMVTATLDSYKMQSGGMTVNHTSFDLAELLQKMKGEFTLPASFDDVTLSYEGPESFTITADVGLIRRILSNLLDNALRHSDIGGAIILRLKEGEEGVTFSVTDRGEGIPPDAIDDIFETFVQVDSEKQTGGHGIGLAFCKMAAEAHGGAISVTSDENAGTTFTVLLPR